MFIDLYKDLKLVPWQFDEATTKANSQKLNNYLSSGQMDVITVPAMWFGFSETIFVPAVAGGRIMGAGMGKDCCYTQAKTHNGNASVFVWCGKPDSRFMTIRGAFFEIDAIHFMGNFWQHQTVSPPDWPLRKDRCEVAIAFEEDHDGGMLKSWSGKNRIRASFFLFRTALLATYQGDEHDAHSDEILFDHIITYGVETVYRSECLQAIGSQFNHVNVYYDCELGVSRGTTVFDIKRGGNIHVSNLTFSTHGGTVLSLGDEFSKSFVGQDNGSFVFDNIKVDTGMFSLGYTKSNPFRLIDMKDTVECFVRMTGHIGHANFDTHTPWYNPNSEAVITTKGNSYNIGLDIWGLDDVTAAKYPIGYLGGLPINIPPYIYDSDDNDGNELVEDNIFQDALIYVDPTSAFTDFTEFGNVEVTKGIHNKPSLYFGYPELSCFYKENVTINPLHDFTLIGVISPNGINPAPHGYAGIFSFGEWQTGPGGWTGGSFEVVMNGARLMFAMIADGKYIESGRTTNEMKVGQPSLFMVTRTQKTGMLTFNLDGVITLEKFNQLPCIGKTTTLTLFGRHAHGKFDQTVVGYAGELAFWDRLLTNAEQQQALNRFRAKWGVN